MNKIPQPGFQVFAKRKNSSDLFCNIYVRVNYMNDVHEKSLGIKCYYDQWNSKEQTILNDASTSRDLKNKLEEICKIKKLLTFHIARHTFATTVTLMNGVPIESISKMLGHSRIIMTQHYSKVADLKIERDSEFLLQKFNQ